MVQNIIELLKDQLNDNLLGKIAGILGENKSGVTAAVGSALPSLLLGLMKKGREPGGAEGLFRMLQEGKHDGGILDNLGSVLGGGSATTNLLSTGKALLGSIFGDKAGGLGDLISSASGISKNAGSSLLGILAPIVMGFLGKPSDRKLQRQRSHGSPPWPEGLHKSSTALRSHQPTGVSN
jgi:hypothetical protein